MKEKTVFEKIIKGEIPSYKIYEDSNHYAFLDIMPFELGHTLVIPKKSYENITEMPEDEYLELQKIVLRLVKHYKKTLGCKIGTLTYGTDVPHVHVHIFPITKDIKVFSFDKTKRYLNTQAEEYCIKLKL